ncbi:Deoxyguanosinetriphosphate triphosphohydrolase [Planctomycetes bacterium Pla163]|uniref:Deoxyguanosinetriphosphate triphosphohydrolase-like protein n=1 Tax=Rohdeia mirabilis TaxID=2528008 RepID=A0A518D428_9BACT|nr:Deoxyguanosinetriphosphate triphosphohydrolase [Planctomycetes bacterium Pla163]
MTNRDSTTPRPYDRIAKEAAEAQRLAPWALRSESSLGRRWPEPAPPLRTEYERDRDRITHSAAFRRLMFKSQVFLEREGDHNRTRLSHSLEVAQVARSIATALRLNESFCEALALCHDIGHPPFGHRGEWALDRLMEPFGGFRHNAQVLRVVDVLERRSPDYAGLNLTREVRESLLKHEKDDDWPDEFRPKPRWPFLEAQLVDLADSTAYQMHDIEDGLRAEMFTEEELGEGSGLWRMARAAVVARHPGFLERSADENLRVKRVSNELLGRCIHDIIEHSHAAILAADLASPADARAHAGMLVGHSAELKPLVAELRRFLFERFYRHPYLMRFKEFADAVMERLFEHYRAHPDEMAGWYCDWAREVGLERAVCDWLAGMTDRYAESEFERVTEGVDRA